MAEEIHEIHERAEKARENTSLAPVTLTMAVMAVLCLEAALVIVSVTLLTGRRHYWMAGCVLGLAGVVVALTGFLC